MKENLKPVTADQFDAALAACRENPSEGFSGPFIHSSPVGNMFRGPFEERAWTVGKETVLLKTWSPEDGWKYFQRGE
jgi:hypothetical protein